MNIGEIWHDGSRMYYFIDNISLTLRGHDDKPATEELGVYFTRLGDLSYGEKWNPPITRTGFCYLSTMESFGLKKVE